MRFKFIISLLITLLISPAVLAVTPFINASYFYHTEPIRYEAFIDDWDGHLWGGNKGVGLTLIETGVSYDKWALSVFQRSVSYAEFHKETAEIFYLVNNKLPLEPGRRYRVELEIKHMLADGVKLSRQIVQTSKFHWSVGVSVLSGKKILDGTLVGYVSAESENDYNFDDIRLNYFYSEDKIFNHEAKNPSGDGFSAEMELTWQPNDKFVVNWFVGDLFAFIDWYAAPTTVAVLESDNKTFDENGYVKIDPILRGNQSQKDFRQRLPWHSNLMTTTQLSQKVDLLLGVKYIAVKTFAELGAAYRRSQNTMRISYLPNVQALSVAMNNKNFHLGFAFDDINISQTRFLDISFSFQYSF